MSRSALQPASADCFLAAPVVYYFDLSHDGAPRLVLAYLAELIRPPWRGLGLIARTRLGEDELDGMDAIGRRLLDRPFDYLHAECQRVRRSASPGCAIAALSASHYTALQIAPPREMPVPISLSRTPCTATTVLAALSDMLQEYEDIGGAVALETFCEAV